MRLVFARPPCKGCGGMGCIANEGLVPRTCEMCNGDGVKLNLLVSVAGLVLFVATTVVPIYLVAG